MTTTEKKSKRLTFTPGERAARALAERQSRLGLPVSRSAARHLANHRRKRNLWQYGKATLP